MNKLHLGCGQKYKEGWVNVDFNKNLKTDIQHDLEKFPYPFKDNTFDEILMDNVLEHLEDRIKTIEELNRISKPHAKITIIVPHYSSFMAFAHLTHKHYFASGTFGNFEPNSWEKYSDKEFNVKATLIWLDSRNAGIFGRFMNWIINRNHYFTERFLCGKIQIDHIKYELEVLK